jgi:hypothetical protein
MEKPQIRRVYRQFTPQERERWLKSRAEIEGELPELVAKGRILKEAAAEPTLSGVVRRAVHRTGLNLPKVAKEAGLTESQVHEFLLGERTLRSDVLDRLARAAGLEFPPDPPETGGQATIVVPMPPLETNPAPPLSP